MSPAVRQLAPGEIVIGFVRPDGSLIGDLADVAVGHDAPFLFGAWLEIATCQRKSDCSNSRKVLERQHSSVWLGRLPGKGWRRLAGGFKDTRKSIGRIGRFMTPAEQRAVADVDRLAEELSASGYYSAALQGASPDVLRRVEAVRQLEALAATLAAAWLDGEFDAHELWLFARGLVRRMTALAEMIAAPSDGEWQRELQVGLLARLQRLDRSKAGLDDNVGSLLVAAMATRQGFANSSDSAASVVFVGSSSNVAHEFFQRCVARLVYRPLGAVDGVAIAAIIEELATGQNGSDRPAAAFITKS